MLTRSSRIVHLHHAGHLTEIGALLLASALIDSPASCSPFVDGFLLPVAASVVEEVGQVSN
jgi:hypothetical protein